MDMLPRRVVEKYEANRLCVAELMWILQAIHGGELVVKINNSVTLMIILYLLLTCQLKMDIIVNNFGARWRKVYESVDI